VKTGVINTPQSDGLSATSKTDIFPVMYGLAKRYVTATSAAAAAAQQMMSEQLLPADVAVNYRSVTVSVHDGSTEYSRQQYIRAETPRRSRDKAFRARDRDEAEAYQLRGRPSRGTTAPRDGLETEASRPRPHPTSTSSFRGLT